MAGSKRLTYFFTFLGILILFTLLFWRFFSIPSFVLSDLTAFPSVDFKTNLSLFLSDWKPIGLGNNYAFSPLFVVTLMLKILLPAGSDLSQKLFLVIPFVLSAVTFFLFSKRLTSNIFTRTVGSLVYMFNPVTVSQFNGGGPAILWGIAFLPLIFDGLERIIENFSLRNLVFFVFFFSIANNFNPQFILMFSPVLLIYLVVFLNKYGYRFVLSCKVPITLAVLLILNLPYVNSFISSIFRVGVAGSTFGLDSSRLSEVYSGINLLNILTFSGNQGGSDWWMGYGQGGRVFQFFGLVIPLLVAVTIFLKKSMSGMEKRFVMIFILLLTFSQLIHYGLLNPIARVFTPFYVWRGPVKITSIFLVPYIYLFVVGLSYLTETVIVNKYRRMLFSAFLLFSLAIFNWYVFSGDMGIKFLYGDSIRIPPSYLGAVSYLKDVNVPLNSKVLLLPFTHRVQLWNSSEMGRFRFLPDESSFLDKEYYEKLNSLGSEDNEDLLELLSQWGVHYAVVIFEKFSGDEFSILNKLSQSYRYWLELISNIPGSELIKSGSQYAVFRLPNPKEVPDLRYLSFSNIIISPPFKVKELNIPEKFDSGWSVKNSESGAVLSRSVFDTIKVSLTNGDSQIPVELIYRNLTPNLHVYILWGLGWVMSLLYLLFSKKI